MTDYSEPESEVARADALRERALRAMAVAQLRGLQSDLARIRIDRALKRSEELRAINVGIGAQLRETIASIAKEQRQAGNTAVQLVITVHDIIDEARLTREIRPDLEPDVVQWAIDSYFAA